MDKKLYAGIIAVIIFLVAAQESLAQGTAFTYQGRLTDSGNPADGLFDMQFRLFDSADFITGLQVGSTITIPTVQVTNGVFTVQLDFTSCPACFNGAARFLEIGLRPAGSPGAFTILSPRQAITSAPYAVRSATAATADNATQLGGQPASGFIQNSNSQQAGTNFNISGDGTAGGTLSAGIVNATTQYNLNGSRVLSVAGTQNLFAGIGAGVGNTSGSNNSYFGFSAGQFNQTGDNNSFFGARAGLPNTASNNSFFGALAGNSNTDGGINSYFGFSAGRFNETGAGNSFFGANAGINNTAGNNSFFGANAGDSNTSGSNNTIIGRFADVGAGDLSNATAIGANARVDQSNSLVLGGISGVNSGVSVNVGIGTTTPQHRLDVNGVINAATQYNINGLRMLAVSGPFNGFTILAASNTFLGESAGLNTMPGPTLDSIQGKFNSFFGANAGKANTTGRANTFFGALAGEANTDGGFNSFFGQQAGRNNTGSSNSFFGQNAGADNAGSQNSFFGTAAGRLSSGSNNSFFGVDAGFSNAADDNSFFGKSAGIGNTTGSENTFFGISAGNGNSSGSNNTIIGAFANVGSNNLTNATAIGHRARVDQSNSIVLGGITGINSGTSVKVGIGTTAPAERLHVVGNGVITGNVGIGTTQPSASLHVSRDTSSITTPVAIIESAGNQAPLAFKFGAAEVARVRADSSGNLVLATLSGASKNIFLRAGDDSGADLFIESSTGNVGIGTTSPDQTLSVNGGASKAGGGSWAVFSDQRLKSIKGSFTAGLNEVMRLQPIRYEYKPDNALGIRAGGEQIGFAAQAVERVIPEAVSRNSRGYLLVNNDPILWAMLNAIKEMKAENDSLKQRLDEMSREREQIKKQQTQIENLKKIICLAHPHTEACK